MQLLKFFHEYPRHDVARKLTMTDRFRTQKIAMVKASRQARDVPEGIRFEALPPLSSMFTFHGA